MNGRTNDEIKEERKAIADYVSERDPNAEIIDSFFEDAPHNAKPLWFLGRSLEALSEADVCIFAEGYEEARGCQLENRACVSYGIQRAVFDGITMHYCDEVFAGV